MSATVNACDGQEGGNTVFTKPNDHQDKTTQEEMSPERNPEDTKAEEGISGDDGTNFHPGARFYLAFSSLAVLAMMVSLDGTSVSVALPVRQMLLGLPLPVLTML